MAYYLPSSADDQDDGADCVPRTESESSSREHMADLKVFWGPEICRLEYLMHLVETGRIKGESCASAA
jgi:hypothetical protein